MRRFKAKNGAKCIALILPRALKKYLDLSPKGFINAQQKLFS